MKARKCIHWKKQTDADRINEVSTDSELSIDDTLPPKSKEDEDENEDKDASGVEEMDEEDGQGLMVRETVLKFWVTYL